MAGYGITTEIIIEATPHKVWSILLDFPAYPQWNPFILSVSGTPRPGSRLHVCIQPGERRTTTFRPNVLQVSDGQTLRWRGHLGIPGFFDGEHFFELIALGDEGTRFIQGENFSGLFAGLIFPSMKAATATGFKAMNQALKQRAETSHTLP